MQEGADARAVQGCWRFIMCNCFFMRGRDGEASVSESESVAYGSEKEILIILVRSLDFEEGI